MTTDTLTYEPLPGHHIATSCKEAVALAIKNNMFIAFDFNGIGMLATPDSAPTDLEQQYHEESERRRKEYEDSQAGKDAAATRAETVKQRQATCDALLESLAQTLHTCPQAEHVAWLRKFAEVADDLGVKFDDRSLIPTLESAGYKDGCHVGQPSKWFRKRKHMAEYIFGQAISCLKNGMPPHPITLSFCDKYFALPEEYH